MFSGNYRTIWQAFQETAARFPNHLLFQVAQVKKSKVQLMSKVTFNDMKQRADVIASFLVKSGIGKEDRVVIVGNPGPEWIASFLATVKIGAIAAPLETRLGQELKDTLSVLEPKLAIIETEVLTENQLKTLQSEIETIIDFKHLKSLAISDQKVKVNSDPHLPAVILRTSGTMGKPKLPVLTHANFTSDVRSSTELIPITEKDSFISIAPWHHAFPLMSTLLIPLFTGASVTYTPSSKSIKAVCKAVKPTLFFGVPKVYNLIYKEVLKSRIANLIVYPPVPEKLSQAIRRLLGGMIGTKLRKEFGGQIRFFFSGSAPMSKKVLRFFKWIQLMLIEGYGMSEASPVISASRLGTKTRSGFPAPSSAQIVGSVGTVLSIVSYEIRNKDQSGVGELVVKGPNVFPGYWSSTGPVKQGFDQDGFFHTGDLALERDGYLFLKGRKKRMILLPSGKNIFPEQVEKELRTIPEVKELLIVQRKEKGELRGIKALVYPDRGLIKESSGIESRRAIHALIKAKLEGKAENWSPHLKPIPVEIRAEPFEKTATQDIKVHLYT